jgi:hypothetical protein
MQSHDQNSRTEGGVNHPSAAEWMAFHYGEISTDRKRELREHLAQCAECGRENKTWAHGIAALDEWQLPEPRATQPRWQPVPIFKWAAAAALVLVVGLVIGRQSAAAGKEIASLKTTVSQLAEKVEQQRIAEVNEAAVSEEVAQLLSDYSQLNEEQRVQDRKTIALALRDMEARIVKLRAELETVAVNTESGFRQTQEGLTQLASFTANEGNASGLSNPESQNR